MKFIDGPIPHAHVPAASLARETMIEAIAEHDDELMAAWVAGRELGADQVKAALRRVTLASRGVPVLVGAAFRNLGIHNLLDAVVDYLPSPLDVGVVRGRDPRIPTVRRRSCARRSPTTSRLPRSRSRSSPTSPAASSRSCASTPAACASATPCSTRRAASSSRCRGSSACSRTTARTFARSSPAMIGAVLTHGHAAASSRPATRCAIRARRSCSIRSRCRPPVIGVVVEPETDEDAAKLMHALERARDRRSELSGQDRPGVRPDRDQRDGRAPPRDRRRSPAPRVRRQGAASAACRSRIARPSRGAPRARTSSSVSWAHAASTGTSGWWSNRPIAGGGYVYENRAPSSDIPADHAPAVEAGVAEAVERGVIAGFPMTDLRVQVVGGSYHPVDSNNFAFKVAGSKAFVAAANQALLRPCSSQSCPSRSSLPMTPSGMCSAISTRDVEKSLELPHGPVYKPSPVLSRWPRCSVTRPTCDRGLEAAPRTRWSSITTLKCPRRSAKT